MTTPTPNPLTNCEKAELKEMAIHLPPKQRQEIEAYALRKGIKNYEAMRVWMQSGWRWKHIIAEV